MNEKQMRTRCPSARFVAIAELPEHDFVFPVKSENRGCGVMSVMPQKGMSVWGVVYEIDELDVGSLDRAEGYSPGRTRNTYERIERIVFRDGKRDTPLSVHIYQAFTDKSQLPRITPNDEYKRLVVDGAKAWRLPDPYIKRLEAIEVQ